MMSRNTNSAQNKEWSGDPLLPIREHPKTYVESAGGTYEEYVWVLERKGDSSANIKWKCKFCATERIGPRLSIAAHITGLKFGTLQVRSCPTAPNDVKAKIIEEENVKKSKAAKRKAESVEGILQSCAQAAAAQSTGKVTSPPPKRQSDDGPRLKQTRNQGPSRNRMFSK